MSQQYARPPITEAVIEFRLEEQLAKDVLQKIHRRLTTHFPVFEEQNIFQVQVGTGVTNNPKNEFFGYKLTSTDQADILALRPKSFARSRLPPYIGWPEFRKRTEAEWSEFRRVAKSVRLARIGIRYINRIDIPSAAYKDPKVEQFLRIGPHLPAELPRPILNFMMQTVLPLNDEGCTTIINNYSAPSPLLDHKSLVVDVDVGRDADIPRSDDQIWDLGERMHSAEKRIFEACITDEARKLFS